MTTPGTGREVLRTSGRRALKSGIGVFLMVGLAFTMARAVIERTRELAETNAALVAEMNERRVAEQQKIDLLKRLVTTQEDERRRIARDLHDHLGQRLTALRLKIELAPHLFGSLGRQRAPIPPPHSSVKTTFLPSFENVAECQ